MAVVDILTYVTVTFLPLWLGISLSIPGLSQARPSQHFTSPEVVIPLKLINRGKGAEALGWLSYSLRFGGQRHVIHMKAKKLLVSPHLPVLTYTEQHVIHEDQPFVQDDCYYHGFVEGVPESLVALSTCSGGFRGMLHINDLAYEIEPIKLSATFEHLVYKIDIDETQVLPMRCGLTEEQIPRQLERSYNFTLKQSSYEGAWTHRRWVEIIAVVDKARYLFSESNVTKVKCDIINIINIGDSYYDHIHVDLIFTGIEVWTTENLVDTSVHIDSVLQAFNTWKYQNLQHRLPHDVGHLFVQESEGGKLGVAYVGTACFQRGNSAVNEFKDHSYADVSYTLTHELGHNLGMEHDKDYCVCSLKKCIMDPYKQATHKFSNCSYAKILDHPWNYCIAYRPRHASIRVQYCGNQIVEEGEECDCGIDMQCAKDPCCFFNCTLRSGASCAYGLCCKDCKFMPLGTLCRDPVNKCDLPEWCNGTSHQCPDDVYMQDGTPCNDGAHCYKKTCNTHDMQCKEIFGKDARSASQRCYSKVNTQGDRFGYCHIVEQQFVQNSFKACGKDHTMCGRVQCVNVSKIPVLQEHRTVYQYHLDQITCWSTDYHLGMTIPDIGQVKEGTPCAPGKICINKRCASFKPPQTCQNETCNMRGVCNNKHHCHCHPEWSPPNCSEKGYGGSEDSGPPPGTPIPLSTVITTTTTTTTGNVPIETTVPGDRNSLKRRSPWLLWLLILIVLCLYLPCIRYTGVRKKSAVPVEKKFSVEKKPPEETGKAEVTPNLNAL